MQPDLKPCVLVWHMRSHQRKMSAPVPTCGSHLELKATFVQVTFSTIRIGEPEVKMANAMLSLPHLCSALQIRGNLEPPRSYWQLFYLSA